MRPLFLIVLLCTAPGAFALPPDFTRDIRPILAKNCFKCHGPDERNRKADLRLDTREGAIEAALVPGKPEQSELVRRINAPAKSKVMPPPSTKLTLTPGQKEMLKQWIAAGAEYQQH